MRKTTLQKLAIIQKKATLLEIIFSHEGVALAFFDLDNLTRPEQIEYFAVDRAVGRKDILLRRGIGVLKYYPTLAKAVDAEYRRLTTVAKT